MLNKEATQKQNGDSPLKAPHCLTIPFNFIIEFYIIE